MEEITIENWLDERFTGDFTGKVIHINDDYFQKPHSGGISISYWKDGYCHCLSGPAEIYYDSDNKIIKQIYSIHGKEYSKENFELLISLQKIKNML